MCRKSVVSVVNLHRTGGAALLRSYPEQNTNSSSCVVASNAGSVFRSTLGAAALAWAAALLRPQRSDPSSSRSWPPPGWWTSPSVTATAWPSHMVRTLPLLLCHTLRSSASVFLSDVFLSPHHRVDNEVYAWGNNSMGQCGQGNSTGPITKPKKVVGLDGVAIQQISAGTSHSLAWTALPRDR